ncbi:cobyrinic acid a,c-diamide synthase [Lentibacillus sp. CBA3610]|uniref:cobyrinic acid a,c-diamide synthase n=1 Tax=Lentibacillus sp. CBA3610 TaxID=2518176 RepID=UPI0015955BF3|nr:cobyrinic acid a,c-diamide synthase [Lentibacillus sp. CBA3610]QKY69052.1 cobyrinic acid a,c-diamide synthase [Lentibacillus sp. CBA3610]
MIFYWAETEATLADMFTESFIRGMMLLQQAPWFGLHAAAGRHLTISRALDQHKKDYFFQQYEELIHLNDYIIFDMGAGAAQDMLSFVFAANECIVVTTPEPTSITDAYGLIKHIVNNRPDMPISVIMNRSASTKQGHQALERFRQVIRQFLNIEIRKMGALPEDKTVSAAVIAASAICTIKMKKLPFSKAMKKWSIVYLEDKRQTRAIKHRFLCPKIKEAHAGAISMESNENHFCYFRKLT